MLFGIVGVIYLWIGIVANSYGFGFLIRDPGTFMICSALIIAAFFTVLYVETVVKTYKSQKRHVRMLKYEMVRLKTLQFGMEIDHHTEIRTQSLLVAGGANSNAQSQKSEENLVVDESVKFLEEYVAFLEKNDDPPTIGCISITPTVLYSLYLYIALAVGTGLINALLD